MSVSPGEGPCAQRAQKITKRTQEARSKRGGAGGFTCQPPKSQQKLRNEPKTCSAREEKAKGIIVLRPRRYGIFLAGYLERIKPYQAPARTLNPCQKLRNEPKAAHPGGSRMTHRFFARRRAYRKLRNEPKKQGARVVGQAVSPANLRSTKRTQAAHPGGSRMTHRFFARGGRAENYETNPRPVPPQRKGETDHSLPSVAIRNILGRVLGENHAPPATRFKTRKS
jgi:hypothetical protein